MSRETTSATLRNRRPQCLWAVLLTVALFLLVHGYALWRPYVVNDDTRQQIFWMQAWEDPGLYPEQDGAGWLSDYARHYVSPGVRGLYRLAAHVVDPLTFSKILTGLEFTLLGGVLFLLGASMGGREEDGGRGYGAAWAVLCAFWLMPFFLHNMSGGLARSFAAPLMALFLLAWVRGSALGMLLLLFLLSLFIPYIYALCAVAVAVAWLGWKTRLLPRPPLPVRLWHYPVCVLTALPAWWFNKGLTATGYGPMVSAEVMGNNPLYGPFGRFEIIPVPSLLHELVVRPLELILPIREWGPPLGVASALVLAFVLYKGGRSVHWRRLGGIAPPFAAIALASLIMYAAARILLLTLFIPSRYLEYTTNLFYCLLAGIILWAGFRSLLPYLSVGMRRWLPRGAVAMCLCLAVFRLHGEALDDYGGAAELYAAVKDTPRNSVFAGHPYTMDNVLAFGQRNVVASYELAHPWSLGMWHRLRPPLVEMLRACYATDAETVRRFAVKYGVDYFVVDEGTYSSRFTQGRRRFVPVCEAPMPDWARGICRKTGLDFEVYVRENRVPGYPSDHPMFEPYGEMIRDVTKGAELYALLDKKLFPCRDLGGGYRLIPLRPSPTGQGTE